MEIIRKNVNISNIHKLKFSNRASSQKIKIDDVITLTIPSIEVNYDKASNWDFVNRCVSFGCQTINYDILLKMHHQLIGTPLITTAIINKKTNKIVKINAVLNARCGNYIIVNDIAYKSDNYKFSENVEFVPKVFKNPSVWDNMLTYHRYNIAPDTKRGRRILLEKVNIVLAIFNYVSKLKGYDHKIYDIDISYELEKNVLSKPIYIFEPELEDHAKYILEHNIEFHVPKMKISSAYAISFNLKKEQIKFEYHTISYNELRDLISDLESKDIIKTVLVRKSKSNEIAAIVEKYEESDNFYIINKKLFDKKQYVIIQDHLINSLSLSKYFKIKNGILYFKDVHLTDDLTTINDIRTVFVNALEILELARSIKTKK